MNGGCEDGSRQAVFSRPTLADVSWAVTRVYDSNVIGAVIITYFLGTNSSAPENQLSYTHSSYLESALYYTHSKSPLYKDFLGMSLMGASLLYMNFLGTSPTAPSPLYMDFLRSPMGVSLPYMNFLGTSPMGASSLYMDFLKTSPMRASPIFSILLRASPAYLVIIETSSVHYYYYPYDLSGRSHGFHRTNCFSVRLRGGTCDAPGISPKQVAPFRTLPELVA